MQVREGGEGGRRGGREGGTAEGGEGGKGAEEGGGGWCWDRRLMQGWRRRERGECDVVSALRRGGGRLHSSSNPRG